MVDTNGKITFGFEWETDAIEEDVARWAEVHRWNWYRDGSHYELNSPPTIIERPAEAYRLLYFIEYYDYCDDSESACGAHVHIKTRLQYDKSFVYHYYAAIPIFWRFYAHSPTDGFFRDREYWAGPNLLVERSVEIPADAKDTALTYNYCCRTLENRLAESEPIRSWTATIIIISMYLAGLALSPRPEDVERNWKVVYEQPSPRKPFYPTGPLKTEADIPMLVKYVTNIFGRSAGRVARRVVEVTLLERKPVELRDFSKIKKPTWMRTVDEEEKEKMKLMDSVPITAYI